MAISRNKNNQIISNRISPALQNFQRRKEMEKEVKSKAVLFVLLIGILSVIAPAVVREQSAFAGSIVAWGDNYHGQCNVPSPNADFTAIAAGYEHSLGLKQDAHLLTSGIIRGVYYFSLRSRPVGRAKKKKKNEPGNKQK